MGNGLDPASQQILMDPRWEGKVSSIAWFTGLIDKYVVMFISLIGFLIILSTMLRNVLAALYFSNPKFWNRIDMMKGTTSKAENRNYSTIERILCFLPNLRDWIDIDETSGDPKDYLIKAIPQAIIGTFIGVLIFSSYYRKIIANVAGLGLHVFDKYFLSRNLVADFDAIVDEGTDYKFTYGTTEGGKRKTKIARKVYDEVRANYGNIREAETKQMVGVNIENTLSQNLFPKMESYITDPKWVMTFEVESKGSVMPTSPFLTNTDSFQEFWDVFRMGDLAGSKTTDNDKDNNYLVVFVTFKLNEMQVSSQMQYQLGATINTGIGDATSTGWKYTLPNAANGLSGTGYYESNGKKYIVEASGTTLTIKPVNSNNQPVTPDKGHPAPNGDLVVSGDSATRIKYGSSGAEVTKLTLNISPDGNANSSVSLSIIGGSGTIPQDFEYGKPLIITPNKDKQQKPGGNTTEDPSRPQSSSQDEQTINP